MSLAHQEFLPCELVNSVRQYHPDPRTGTCCHVRNIKTIPILPKSEGGMALCIFTVTSGIDCEALLVSFLLAAAALRSPDVNRFVTANARTCRDLWPAKSTNLASLPSSCFHTKNAANILRSTGKAPDTGSVRIEQLGRHHFLGSRLHTENLCSRIQATYP